MVPYRPNSNPLSVRRQKSLVSKRCLSFDKFHSEMSVNKYQGKYQVVSEEAVCPDGQLKYLSIFPSVKSSLINLLLVLSDGVVGCLV